LTSPEALFDRLVFADARRRSARGETPYRLSVAQRLIQEPFFNFIGMLVGWAWRCAPFALRRSMDLWLCQKMGGHAAEYNPSLSGRVAEAIALGERLSRETGKWPAFLFLTAHAPTEGPFQWVRFEVLRQGLIIAFDFSRAGQAAGFRMRNPECLLAVDPYALDSVPVSIGATYAAFIHQVYFAFDRQFSTQSFFQRLFFLRRTGYPWAGWRLLRRMRHGIPVLMALGGGLPVNARILYAAREFIQRLRFPIPVPKRKAEYDWVRLLEGQGHEDPAIDGHLAAPLQAALRGQLEQWGFSGEQARTLLDQFMAEFSWPVPYRERLWNVLLRRVAARGRGLVVVSADVAETVPHVSLGQPMGIYRSSSGDILRIRGQEDRSLSGDTREAARTFSREFAGAFGKLPKR